MRLERDKALFSGSRLYRQAGEIADELPLNTQVAVPLGFRELSAQRAFLD